MWVRFPPAVPIFLGGCYVTAKRNGVPRKSVKGLTKKFLRMSEIYRYFSKDWKNILDFSNESLLELYNHESHGGLIKNKNNGFVYGKKWLNVHVSMWKDDIEQKILFKHELYEDKNLPHWWLDSIFNKK